MKSIRINCDSLLTATSVASAIFSMYGRAIASVCVANEQPAGWPLLVTVGGPRELEAWDALLDWVTSGVNTPGSDQRERERVLEPGGDGDHPYDAGDGFVWVSPRWEFQAILDAAVRSDVACSPAPHAKRLGTAATITNAAVLRAKLVEGALSFVEQKRRIDPSWQWAAVPLDEQVACLRQLFAEAGMEHRFKWDRPHQFPTS